MNDKGKRTSSMSAVKTVTTTYHEQKIGNTLYRVTGVFKGEFELGKALEDLTIRKILREKNTAVALEV